MVLLAYGGFASSLLLSAVAALWLIGMPEIAIVPVVVQLAGLLLAVAMAVNLVVMPFSARRETPPSRAAGRSKQVAPHLALLQVHQGKNAPPLTVAPAPPPIAASKTRLLKPIPRAPR